MQDLDRSFLLNTVAAILYTALAGLLVYFKPENAYYCTLGLVSVTGFHLAFLFISALKKIRKLLPVGFTGFSIIAVLLVHIIFWLLFINIP
jgi:hypothetical protein